MFFKEKIVQKNTVETLEQAMEVVSASIANLIRFVDALNKFLQANGLGSAEYSADYPAVTLSTGDHGYDIAMFHLRNAKGEDVIYFYIYTDGTVWGENFSDASGTKRTSRVNKGCTYTEAAEEVLRTIGVLDHSKLSLEKVNAAVKALLD